MTRTDVVILALLAVSYIGLYVSRMPKRNNQYDDNGGFKDIW